MPWPIFLVCQKKYFSGFVERLNIVTLSQASSPGHARLQHSHLGVDDVAHVEEANDTQEGRVGVSDQVLQLPRRIRVTGQSRRAARASRGARSGPPAASPDPSQLVKNLSTVSSRANRGPRRVAPSQNRVCEPDGAAETRDGVLGRCGASPDFRGETEFSRRSLGARGSIGDGVERMSRTSSNAV